MTKIAEADYAKLVCDWLVNIGWDVYVEVSTGVGAPRADIVATMGNSCCWVIECKVRPGMGLIDQATTWIGYADFISIAVPPVKSFTHATHWQNLCRWYGIGFFSVHINPDPSDHYWKYSHKPPVKMNVRPHLQPPIYPSIVVSRRGMIEKYLHDEQRYGVTEYDAGTKGEYFTLYKRTRKNLLEYVAKHPGCTMREAVEGIEHHWGDNRTAIQVLRVRIIDWRDFDDDLTYIKRGGRWIFFEKQITP